jgi:hypothetical protein
MPPWADVAPPRPQRRGPLEDHLPEEEHEHTRHVEAVREEGSVARVRPLVRLDPADGEDHLLGLAGQEIPATCAAAGEQADARRASPLDLRAVVGLRARHLPAALLLHPAEGRDVVIRAEQDPGLARACLRAEIRLPLGERVAFVGEPARHLRRAPVAHGATQDRQPEPVDLEEDDPRLVRARLPLRAARDALRHAQHVRLVVVRPEDRVERDREDRDEERGEQCIPERVDGERARRDLRDEQEHRRVEREHEQQADDERERHAKRRNHRRQDRVEHTEDRRRDERSSPPVDGDAGNDPGREQQRGGRESPGDE